LIPSFEKQYQNSLAYIERELKRKQFQNLVYYELSSILKPVFDAIVGIIHENHTALGDDADEFAEALCFETGFMILEYAGMASSLMDLLMVSKYIAGEAAVAYSVSGVVDVLDKEHQITRIAAAFLGGLVYLLLSSTYSMQ
jgi:hypothetical protein